jgi:hypothetical protein
LQYDIVPIYDPFGPTKEDPNFQVGGWKWVLYPSKSPCCKLNCEEQLNNPK